MVAITSVVLTVMMFLAGGLITEHNRFVDNRDTLKSASDAAVVAATQHLHRLPTSMSDSDVETALEDTARRYAFLVVEANSSDPVAPSDMDINLRVDRAAGVVGVDVAAKMRGVLYKQLVSAQGEKKMAVRSGAEQEVEAEEEVTPSWLVLALDYSGSMHSTIDGHRRIDVVRNAAKTMVDELMVTTHMSMGVIPWAEHVCVDDECRLFEGALSPTPLKQQVHRVLDALLPIGNGTFSTAGILEATRMLQGAPGNVNRGLVLLTDGEDTICQQDGRADEAGCTPRRRQQLREDACDAAKDEDITIWVVAAMSADEVGSRLGRQLRDCASDGDQHVFVSNVDADDLEGAFESISTQVKVKAKALRRTY